MRTVRAFSLDIAVYIIEYAGPLPLLMFLVFMNAFNLPLWTSVDNLFQ